MAKIGPYTVTAFRGRMFRATQRIAVLDAISGQDGNLVVSSGWSSQLCIIPTATDVSSESAADTLLEQYRETHNDVITVIDQFNDVWENVVVIGVVAVKSALPAPSGYYRVDATWQLLPEVERP